MLSPLPLATLDDESCLNPSSYGCTDIVSCNCDFEANQDDGTWIYPEEIYIDCSGNCINDIDQYGECNEIDIRETPKIELIQMIDVFGIVQKEHNQGKTYSICIEMVK